MNNIQHDDDYDDSVRSLSQVIKKMQKIHVSGLMHTSLGEKCFKAGNQTTFIGTAKNNPLWRTFYFAAFKGDTRIFDEQDFVVWAEEDNTRHEGTVLYKDDFRICVCSDRGEIDWIFPVQVLDHKEHITVL